VLRDIEIEKRANLIGRERNSASESNIQDKKVDSEQLLTAQMLWILQASKDPGG